MSEFRIFCTGGFVGMGATATGLNHGVFDQQFSQGAASLVLLLIGAILLGMLAVIFFGRSAS